MNARLLGHAKEKMKNETLQGLFPRSIGKRRIHAVLAA